MSLELFTRNATAVVPNWSPRLIRLPGGEWHITSTGPLSGEQYAWVSDALPDDLMALAVWADAVHRDGGIPSAAIPYLPGARQDRARTGEALSAKVYANLLNGCGLARIVCLDPHSDVMPALLNRCRSVSAADVIGLAPKEMFDHVTGIIAPDAGAAKRAQGVATLLSVPLYQAGKKRDPHNGDLSGFTCEPLPGGGHYLVIDDICDGGGTFRGLAEAIDTPRERLSLWVSHGIFSGNAAALLDSYQDIYTTDSRTTPGAMRAAAGDRLHLLPVRDMLLNRLL